MLFFFSFFSFLSFLSLQLALTDAEQKIHQRNECKGGFGSKPAYFEIHSEVWNSAPTISSYLLAFWYNEAVLHFSSLNLKKTWPAILEMHLLWILLLQKEKEFLSSLSVWGKVKVLSVLPLGNCFYSSNVVTHYVLKQPLSSSLHPTDRK